MKNAEKIINALRKAFPGHAVEYQYKPIANVNSIFIDRVYIGNFDHDFFEQDFDNPEIEIKIKAPLNSVKEFLEECEGSGGVGDVIRAVEWGYNKWREESQQNS